MTHEDRVKLMNELDGKWPDKFTEADMAFWARELDRNSIDEVLEVLNRYKAECKFVPKLPEIQRRLRERAGGSSNHADAHDPAKQYRTLYAQEIARRNPALLGRPERELLLRHKRFEFFRYVRSLVEKDQTPSACQQRLIDAKRDIMIDRCAADLRQAGEEAEQAKSWAAWIASPQHDFEAVMAGDYEVAA